jgi:hypothetical protein
LEDAKFISPRIAHDPKIQPALRLVIPSRCAQRFEASDLSFHVIRFQVEMRAILGSLYVIRALQEYADVGIRKAQLPVDVVACWASGFRDGS